MKNSGFTLLELSIVLVIIGLIVGGVLVGRDLIKAAEIRAQISQMEKYQLAVNTFRLKYGYLPGDIPEPTASGFGFQPRGIYPGQGDGNGLVEITGLPTANPQGVFFGEQGVFWVDLSMANLIEGAFNTASINSSATVTSANVGLYLPTAKIGRSNYIYVYEGGWINATLAYNATGSTANDHINYFGLAANPRTGGATIYSDPGITVAEAYAIDSKMDDGLPMSGKVTAEFLLNNGPGGAAAGWPDTAADNPNGYSYYPTPQTWQCFSAYHMDGTQTMPMHYVTEVNGGAGVNCALSFKFQ